MVPPLSVLTSYLYHVTMKYTTVPHSTVSHGMVPNIMVQYYRIVWYHALGSCNPRLVQDLSRPPAAAGTPPCGPPHPSAAAGIRLNSTGLTCSFHTSAVWPLPVDLAGSRTCSMRARVWTWAHCPRLTPPLGQPRASRSPRPDHTPHHCEPRGTLPL